MSFLSVSQVLIQNRDGANRGCVFLLGFAFTSGDSSLSSPCRPTQMPSCFLNQVDVGSWAPCSEDEHWSLTTVQENFCSGYSSSPVPLRDSRQFLSMAQQTMKVNIISYQ